MLATLRRVAPAQTLPRGESGPEAGDGSVAQTCSSVLPRRSLYRFRRGFVFSEKEYWDQLPSLSSESKREASHGAFFAPGLPYGFLAGYPVLPTQQSILSRPRAIAPHAVSLQSEKHSGDYRENEAGMDCEPLQSVLRGSPPLTSASVLSTSRCFRLCLFPYHRSPGSQVPCESPNEVHAAFTPDTAWPVSRYPPCSSQGREAPWFRCHLSIFDASSAVRLHSSPSLPHDVIKNCHVF